MSDLTSQPIRTADQLHESFSALSTSITPDQLPEILEHYLLKTPDKPDSAVAIWGKVGIGKTSGVRAFARNNGYRLVVMLLSLYDPTDLKGIPVRMDDGKVRWVNTSFLPQQMTTEFEFDGEMAIEFDWKYAEHIVVDFPDDPGLIDKVEVRIVNTKRKVVLKTKTGVGKVTGRIRIQEKAIIFLDEISTANTDTQNAALGLVLDRRVGEYELPAIGRVVAAGNTEDDGAFINPISFPLANRFAHIVLRVSVPQFLSYAMDRIDSPNRDIMISFLNMWGAEYLHRYNADTLRHGDYGSPTPRSWENWCLQYDQTKPEWMRRQITVGILGSDTALRLTSFLNTVGSFPNPTDILNGEPYKWNQKDRISSLMMIGLLVTRLKERYTEQKHEFERFRNTKGNIVIKPEQMPKEWITAMNGVYGFMNRYMEDDGRTSGHYMVCQIAKIPPMLLGGSEYDKFCVDCVRIIREVMTLVK